MTEEELGAIEAHAKRWQEMRRDAAWAATGISLAEHVPSLLAVISDARAEIERLRDLCALLESEPFGSWWHPRDL